MAALLMFIGLMLATLKLAGVIAWPWIAIAIPFLPMAFGLAVMLVGFVIYLVALILD